MASVCTMFITVCLQHPLCSVGFVFSMHTVKFGLCSVCTLFSRDLSSVCTMFSRGLSSVYTMFSRDLSSECTMFSRFVFSMHNFQ